MRKWIVGGALAAALAIGGATAAIAATNTHDPNVNGGRFCVDYVTNVAHYDWKGLPCGTDQYLDQTTYSEPVVPSAPAPSVTRTDSVTATVTNDTITVTLKVPSGDVLESVVQVVQNEVAYPFTDSVNANGIGTITFTDPSLVPSSSDTFYISYTTSVVG